MFVFSSVSRATLTALLAVALSTAPGAQAQTARAPAAQRAAPVALRAAPVVTRAIAPAPPLPRNEFIRSMDLEHSKMDSDKNGQVSRLEIEQFQRGAALARAQQRNRALFAALDSDRNGQVSPAEFARMPSSPPRVDASGLLRFDSNRDGTISMIEHRAGTLANFDRLDVDKDGSVSEAEMKAGGIGGR